MTHNGIGNITKIFCVLSSPWYASQTRTIKYEKNNTFIFNDKLADSLIEKEVDLFEAENISKFNNNIDRVRMIEFKNMKTLLNGYNIISPLNKKAQKLEMTVFFSMSSENVLKNIEKIIFSNFHTKEVRFCSFALASFAVARNMLIEKDSFLLVDIAGEMTDISIIKKDILANSISYPLGRNFIVRGVAQKLHTSLMEAKSYISIYKDGYAVDAIEKKVGPIISTLKNKWLLSFQESLIKISEDISVPSTIYITVDQDLKNFFSEIIKHEEFHQYTLSESKFNILFLDTESLHGIASFSSNVKRDSFLIIGAIYINNFIC